MAHHDDVEPHLFIVFGGTGDLMQRKLLPAVYRLGRQGHLGEGSFILATARSRDHDDESYRRWARTALEEAGVQGDGDPDTWCDRRLFFQSIGEGDAKAFAGLRERIEQVEEEHGLSGNRVFYLALPPQAFRPTIEGLGEAGLHTSPAWTRLVIEKPFGHDLESAQTLNELVHAYFREEQVFRIDHYLGKETVQNLLIFRFANPLFESVWNRDRVASVQVTVSEALGLEARAGYYERVGALRDMVQNHLTQLLTLTAMEAPAAFDADAIRDEKVKVLRSLREPGIADAVFGQYGAGSFDGHDVPAYRDEPGVAENSRTETFAALRLHVDNWRWQGVPFYLRTGKRLPRRLTQITVRFKRPPVALFEPHKCRLHANALVLTLQPDEGFDLCFDVKAPGPDIALQTQRLDFRYAQAFGELPDGYETLLHDVLSGDQTLFVRADEVEAAWRLYAPLLEKRPEVFSYEAGSWGPAEADTLIKEPGHEWLTF